MRRFHESVLRASATRIVVMSACAALAGCGGGIVGGSDGSSDTTAPTVAGSSVSPSATNVDPNVALTLTFSESVDPDTVNGLSIVVINDTRPVLGTVSASGATAVFSKSRPLALKSKYAFLATTGVRDLAGNPLPVPYSTTFTTRDGAWANARLIEGNSGGNASVPQVAVDAVGNAIAVWQQEGVAGPRIWANRFIAPSATSAGGWSVPQSIGLDSADALFPQIAMDRNGNAIAVWQQSDGTSVNIVANRFSNGVWNGAELIESQPGNAINPRIAVNAAGNAVIVWSQFNAAGTTADIWANQFGVTTGWAGAVLIESDPINSAVNPDIAIDANGDALAVWQQAGMAFDDIWVNRLSGGSWSGAVKIETADDGHALSPRIAMDSNGNAMAVWYQFDGTRTDVWVNRFAAGGAWGTPTLIETDNADNAAFPRIAFDAGGNAHVVWHQSDGSRFSIFSKRYTAANGWETIQLLETLDTGDAGFPRIALDPNGNAIAVWQQSDGTRTSIWANRYGAGTGWGSAQLIETVDAGPALDPQIAIDAGGYAIVVWTQSNGSRYNINAARFE